MKKNIGYYYIDFGEKRLMRGLNYHKALIDSERVRKL